MCLQKNNRGMLMAMPVRVNEDNYVSLQQMADAEGRSVTNMLNRILDERFGRSTVGTPVAKIGVLQKTETQKTTGISGAQYDSYEKKSEPSGSGALEQLCCQHPTRPCKHWVWDNQTGEGYRNVLSGRYKEADSF